MSKLTRKLKIEIEDTNTGYKITYVHPYSDTKYFSFFKTIEEVQRDIKERIETRL